MKGYFSRSHVMQYAPKNRVAALLPRTVRPAPGASKDPGCCVARICKRTMPCLRPRNDCPTCKEIGYDIKNDPLGVLCCVGWFAVCAASLAYLIYWIVMRAT